jgi:hypothetical protein
VFTIENHTSWNPTVIIATAVTASMNAGLRPLSSCVLALMALASLLLVLLLLMLGSSPEQAVVELLA